MYELDMVNKLSTVLENIDLHIETDIVLTEGAKFDNYKEVAKNTLAKFWEWVVETTKRIYDQIRITLAGRSNAILTKDVTIKKACFEPSLLDYNNGLKEGANEDIDMKKGDKVDLRKIANTLSIVRSKKNSSKEVTSEYTGLITSVLNDCNFLVKACESSIVNKITKKNEPEETKKSEAEILAKYTYKNGRIARAKIASDVVTRKLTRDDIINLSKIKEIDDAFYGTKYEYKKPKEYWDKKHLDLVFCSVASEGFNLDYLLYLNDVADFVYKANFKKRKAL